MRVGLPRLSALAAGIGLLLCCATPSLAGPITNGNFGTGTFAGWTLWTTGNGTIGDGMFEPVVTTFDVKGTGTPITAAAFNVGQATGGGQPPEEGGGVFQNVILGSGNLTLSADIAVHSPGNNAEGGIFSMLFDGNVVATESFGTINANETDRGTLTAVLSNVAAGSHEIRFEITRHFAGAEPFATPVQYLTNVSASGSAASGSGGGPAVPEPGTVALLGLGLAALVGYHRRRRRAV